MSQLGLLNFLGEMIQHGRLSPQETPNNSNSVKEQTQELVNTQAFQVCMVESSDLVGDQFTAMSTKMNSRAQTA